MVEFAHAGRYGPGTFEDVNRTLLKTTPITVYNAGTAVLASLYTDRTKTTPAANPFLTDARGNGYFFANPGEYDVNYAGISLPVTVPLDPEDMAAVPAGGGAWRYTFSTTTTDSDPGLNTLRLNNGTQTSATFLYIDDVNQASVDMQAWFATLDDSTSTTSKGTVELVNESGSKVAIYRVSGGVVDATGYYKIPLVFVAGNAGFINAEKVYFRFSRTGDKGDSGSPGGTEATDISFSPTGTISSTNVQTALAEVSGDVEAHKGLSSGAHAASAISFAPGGTIAATTAQAAISEVATDAASALSAHESDTTSVHGIANTSQIQLTTQKGVANGYAGLDANGVIPTSQLPPLAISDTFVAASQAAMLALTAQRGDVARRTDFTPNRIFLLTADPATTLGNWLEITAASAVTSVDGNTGAVDLSAVYQALTGKGAANGYASLDGGTRVPVAQLATGTPTGAKYLRDDRSWQVPPVADSIRAYASSVVAQTGNTGSITDLTGLSIDVDVFTGETIEVELWCPGTYATTIGTGVQLQIANAANTELQRAGFVAGVTNDSRGLRAIYVVTTPGSYTYKGRFMRSAGTGTANNGYGLSIIQAFIRAIVR